MEHEFFFISGLPRSGTTMLAAILRQNPMFHAGMSSPVLGMVDRLISGFSAGSEFSTTLTDRKRKSIVRGIFDNYYDDADEDVIFDTNRSWTSMLPLLVEMFPATKIIAMVRDLAWIMDSIERAYRRQPYEYTRMFSAQERATVYTRVDALGQCTRLVGISWSSLKEAVYGEHSASVMIVDYNSIAKHPGEVVTGIYDFIGKPMYNHDFNSLEFDDPGFDDSLGLKGLHKVRKEVSFVSRDTILPPDLFHKYEGHSFWKDPGVKNFKFIEGIS